MISEAVNRFLLRTFTVLSLLALTTIFCCSNAKANSEEILRTLPGTWESADPGYANGKRYLTRASELKDEYGIVFSKDGKLMERRNAGWCGTPPITYGDFKGEWQLAGNSELDMEVDSWGGRTKSLTRVRVIDPDNLELHTVDSKNIPRE